MMKNDYRCVKCGSDSVIVSIDFEDMRIQTRRCINPACKTLIYTLCSVKDYPPISSMTSDEISRHLS